MSKILLGMSGGVDSSVSVHLLKKMGHEVIGLYFKLTPESGRDNKAENDAKKVAKLFDIPFYVADERGLFSSAIIESFVKSYALGKTPNPCIYCNAQVKFHLLFHYAKRLGCQKVATGHYANIVTEDDCFYLAKSKDKRKDQTYFLSQLPKAYLPFILFPLGSYTKDEIRKIALNLKLPVAEKKESQEICFIPNDDYIHFLEKEYNENLINEGVFCDTEGNIIGQHNGSYRYTIGQRKGLGLSLGYPAYVTNLDAKKGIVTVGKDENLWHQGLIANEVNFFCENNKKSGKALAKIRSRDEGTFANYEFSEGKLKVHFEKKVRAITPGQSVVLYEDEKLIGAGIIENHLDE